MKTARNSLLPVWMTIIGLALASCSNPQPEAITLLKTAEKLADTHHDSALPGISNFIWYRGTLNYY